MQRAYAAGYNKRHKDRLAFLELTRKFGITPADYETQLAKQDGVCAICRKPDARGLRLAVDHDHRTNELRGLLCFKCNAGLGLLAHDPEQLRNAAAYLEAPPWS